MCLRIVKHGDPVGNQRIMGLFYYSYLNKLCLSSTSNDVIFPLKPSRKFATTLVFLVAKREVKSQMRAYQSQCRALTTVLVGSWLIRACIAVFVCVELGTVCRFPGAVCFWGAAMVVSFLLAVNKSTDMFV